MRDSHGLFDYESKSITKKSLKTASQGQFVRVANDIELQAAGKNEKELGSDAQTLLQIKADQGNSIFEIKYIYRWFQSGSFIKVRNGRRQC